MTTINREVTPPGDLPENPKRLHNDLHEIWGNPRGLKALTIVNHTTLGLRFMVTGMVFFLIGGRCPRPGLPTADIAGLLVLSIRRDHLNV